MSTENKNMTKDGVIVEAGQIWRDLDKRVTDRNKGIEREIEITRVTDGVAHYKGKLGEKHVRIARMHKHSTGFELIGKKIQPAAAS